MIYQMNLKTNISNAMKRIKIVTLFLFLSLPAIPIVAQEQDEEHQEEAWSEGHALPLRQDFFLSTARMMLLRTTTWWWRETFL